MRKRIMSTLMALVMATMTCITIYADTYLAATLTLGTKLNSGDFVTNFGPAITLHLCSEYTSTTDYTLNPGEVYNPVTITNSTFVIPSTKPIWEVVGIDGTDYYLLGCDIVSTYSVTFNTDGGSSVSSLTSLSSGATISAPTAPTKDGYTFDGWYKDSALTTPWNFTSDTVTSDITLYAKWTAVDNNDNSNNNNSNSNTTPSNTTPRQRAKILCRWCTGGRPHQPKSDNN